MDATIFLAKALGIWLTVIGIALIRVPEYFLVFAREFMEDRSKVSKYLGALMALIMGILIVLTHNVWVLDWPVIITLFGWAALIKGITMMIIPEYFDQFAYWYLGKVNLRFFGFVYLILGIILCWKGFF